MSEKDARVAKARRERAVPTVEEIQHVVGGMQSNSDIKRRNRALIAFTLLTGARDSAIASVKLKHVDVVGESVFQVAREARAKFSKTLITYFFPIGDESHQIVDDWVKYLREEKIWSHDDPLFPASNVVLDNNTHHFTVEGLKREHWSTATPIRKIFAEAFTNTGLPYFNPHSFRNTLVHLGETVCQTPEAFKGWSQNLRYEKALTTFCSYGEVSTRRQEEILEGLRSPTRSAETDFEKIAKAVAQELRKSIAEV
ncbi:MAG: site-specific integrase [Nitrospirales bacterium]|nr:site-specific integrase [Nitrospirales bacterium]